MAVVLGAVPPFLRCEGLDVALQIGVFDAVGVVAHRAHEERLAVREDARQAIEHVRGEGVAIPVCRKLAGQLEAWTANDDRRSRGLDLHRLLLPQGHACGRG